MRRLARNRLRTLEALLVRPTAPYREEGPIAAVRAFVEARADRIVLREDPFGNLLLRLRGRGRPRVAFSAHLDHPGFHALPSKGRRGRARFFGRVRREILRRARVRFFGPRGEVRGRLGRLGNLEKGGRSVEVRGLTGPLRGDAFGVFELPSCRVRGDRLFARAADDLAGAAAVLCAIDDLARAPRRPPVLAILTRAEEPGLVGVQGLLRTNLLPRDLLVVGIECSKALPNAPVGGGPVVRVGDLASVFPPEATARLLAAAESLRAKDPSFRYQRRLMDGGTCETTAYAIAGFRAGGLCLPLGNYHNATPSGRLAPEFVSLSDFEGLVRLLVAVARGSGRGTDPGAALRARLARAWRAGKPLLRSRGERRTP